MAQINYALREVQCKIVYYGPGLSGKTTNIEIVHSKAPPQNRGKLTSIATEGDRTLFFDFMPLDLGSVAGMRTKFQLYTVPGQVYYDSTRKLVLNGADGVIFVADSQAEKLDENIESLTNLFKNLRENGIDPDTIPLVMQWNKRDLPTALPVETLEEKLNPRKAPSCEAIACNGTGVFPSLKAISSLVLEQINQRAQLATSVRPKGPAETEGARATPEKPGSAVEAAPSAPSAGVAAKPVPPPPPTARPAAGAPHPP
ncbi:MAG: hypothetical protein HY720_03070, partial [Planctomycetes bacterium]|nr:hypothetical protein [Planctomycetota bacterium]